MSRYSTSRVACLCTQCSLEFWAGSHLDTQPAKHLLGPSVPDAALDLAQCRWAPFPPECYSSLLSLSVVQVGLSEFMCLLHSLAWWAKACCFASGKAFLTCIHLLKVRKKCSKITPCPSTAMARYGAVSTYHNSDVFQHAPVSTELLGLFAVSTSRTDLLCLYFWSFLVEQITESLTLKFFCMKSCFK